MEKINEWLQYHKNLWQADLLAIAQQVVDNHHCLVIKWCHVIGQTSDAYKKIKLQIGKGFGGEIWKTGRLQLKTDLQQQISELYKYPIARIEQLNTVIGVPIFYHSQIIAVVIVGHRSNYVYSENDKQYLITASQQLSKILWEQENG